MSELQTTLVIVLLLMGGLALLVHLSARVAEGKNSPIGRFLNVDGVKLHYLEGEPIVLLHGNGSMIQDFLTSGLVDALSVTHRVLVFDRPGYGYSGRPRRRIWTPQTGGARQGAPLFEVGVSYIYKALARRRVCGIETALPKSGRPGRKLDRHLDALAAHVAAHPDATLAELVDWSRCERGVTVCVATMWATLEALDLSHKKTVAQKKTCHAAEQERADVAAARQDASQLGKLRPAIAFFFT